MQRWSEQASRRLRDGERIETAVPLGENGIVVTSQRVLAFTPDSDGSNFRAIERPNVERVASDTVGETDWIGYALRGLIAGVAGVGVGLVVDFDSLIDLGKIDTQAAGQTGMGGMLGLLGQISNAVGMLDEVLLVGGLLSFAVALGALGMYIESRTPIINVSVAGDADLHVPSAGSDGDTVARLRRHLSGTPAGGPTEGVAGSNDRGTLGTIVDSLTGDGPEATEAPAVAESAVEGPAVERPSTGGRSGNDAAPDTGTRGTSTEASPDEVSEAIGSASEAEPEQHAESGESAEAAEEIREASESAREAPAEEVAEEILDFDDGEE